MIWLPTGLWAQVGNLEARAAAVPEAVAPAAVAETNAVVSPGAAEAVEAESAEVEPAPDLRLHAVYDEVFAVPSGRQTDQREVVFPADIGFPEVRESFQIDREPLAGPGQLESSIYEENELGDALLLQFNRETGRKLEAWARTHPGQRLAVLAGDQILTVEAAGEGLGRRLQVVPLVTPKDSAGLNWDGRSLAQRQRDARDEESFGKAKQWEEQGQIDWLRRGVSVADAMDAALDGDVLSNRLLAWLTLVSGAEGAQHQLLAELCWLAARDQFELWQRLIEQWPEEASQDQLREILVKGSRVGEGSAMTGDERWVSYFDGPPADETADASGGTSPTATATPPGETAGAPQISPADLESEAVEGGR